MWLTFTVSEECLDLQQRIISVTNIMTNEVLTRAEHRAVRRYVYIYSALYHTFPTLFSKQTSKQKHGAVSECNVFSSTGLRKTFCVWMPTSGTGENTIPLMLYAQGNEYVISANSEAYLLHLLWRMRISSTCSVPKNKVWYLFDRISLKQII